MSLDRRRLAHIDRMDLQRGQHAALAQGACLMEATAYVAGEAWSDAPRCASPVIGGLLRTWNDLLPRRPRQELKRHLPRLVGSRGTPAQERQRAALVLDWFFHGPGQDLPPGRSGKQIVGAAVEMARQHAPDTPPVSGQLVLPAPPHRVPRRVLDAVHNLLDQLLAVTEAPATTSSAAPGPAPEAPAPGVAGGAGRAATPGAARQACPGRAPGRVVAPGPHRAPRPHRGGHRAPARRGGLPPTMPAVLPPLAPGTSPRPGASVHPDQIADKRPALAGDRGNGAAS